MPNLDEIYAQELADEIYDAIETFDDSEIVKVCFITPDNKRYVAVSMIDDVEESNQLTLHLVEDTE